VIPRAAITAWRRTAPWADDAQVEQDLVLSRTLVELFSRQAVAEQLAFRGGTALHKLYIAPPGRYSEDIDLVQTRAGPIGPVADEIRQALGSWLGVPRWSAGEGRFTLAYRFDTTFAPSVPMRLKIEINTREHFAVDGFVSRSMAVDNPWFSGRAELVTYTLSELLATKLRALYQRKKGRDLFDLAHALDHPDFVPDLVVAAFLRYMGIGGTPVTRAQVEANMAAKVADPSFLSDVAPLLRTGIAYEPSDAWSRVHAAIVAHLPGAAWKGVPDAN